MKIWIVVLRADADASADGVEDELFVAVYKRLEKAQKECTAHLRQVLEGEPEVHGARPNTEVDWAETTHALDKGRRRFLGRPQAQVDFVFELYQAEVV